MTTIEEKVREMKELQRLVDEANAEIEAIKDEIKAEMGDDEEKIVGEYKIIYKTVVSNKLDSTAMKKALPDVCAAYIKEVVTRPLRVA